jgi:hypothetical protein
MTCLLPRFDPHRVVRFEQRREIPEGSLEFGDRANPEGVRCEQLRPSAR